MKPHMIKCAFCKFSEPFIDREAEYIIDGQATCEDHVDNADGAFGPALHALQSEGESRG